MKELLRSLFCRFYNHSFRQVLLYMPERFSWKTPPKQFKLKQRKWGSNFKEAPKHFHNVTMRTAGVRDFFFAILGRGPRAFQIGKISVENP